MRPVRLHITSSQLEHLLLGIFAGTLSLYLGMAWLLPHFGLLSVPATLGICFGCGLALGLHFARQ